MKFKCSACTFEENITNVRDFKAKYVRDGYAHCPMCNHPTPVKSNKPKPPATVEKPPEPAVEAETVEPPNQTATKTCPDCAEDVKFAAAKCRYCSYSFVEKPAVEYKLAKRETLVRWAFFAAFILIMILFNCLSSAGLRFKSDNAVGATANAVESISHSHIAIGGIAFFLGGTAIAILDKLAQIHHRLSQ